MNTNYNKFVDILIHENRIALKFFKFINPHLLSANKKSPRDISDTFKALIAAFYINN